MMAQSANRRRHLFHLNEQLSLVIVQSHLNEEFSLVIERGVESSYSAVSPK